MGCVRGVLSCFVAVLSWRLLLPFWSLLASSSCRGVLWAAQTANAGAVSLLLWFAGLYSPEESCGKGAGAADNSAPRRPRHRFPIDCGRDCSLGGSCFRGSHFSMKRLTLSARSGCLDYNHRGSTEIPLFQMQKQNKNPQVHILFCISTSPSWSSPT